MKTLKYKDLRPYQRDMVDDGLPIKCVATPETLARAREYWDRHPPRPMPLFNLQVRDESPETVAFRAAEEERRRLKSLAGIARMKTRLAAKANPIDYTKMRWDARRAKFVPITGDKAVAEPTPQQRGIQATINQLEAQRNRDAARKSERRATSFKPDTTGAGVDWSRITKDNAEAVARLNGVWKPEYEKLRGNGRIVMTVGNVLKGLVKRGGTVKWA